MYISDLLSKEKEIDVLGFAKNGLEAMQLIERLNPEVLILDLLMPKVNGLEVLKKVMREYYIPTIILSSLSPSNINTSMQALLMGAFDYIIKPGGMGARTLPQFRKELIKKIKLAAKSQIPLISQSKSVFESKESFRQHRVNEVFQFARKLRKIEENHKKTSQKRKKVKYINESRAINKSEEKKIKKETQVKNKKSELKSQRDYTKSRKASEISQSKKLERKKNLLKKIKTVKKKSPQKEIRKKEVKRARQNEKIHINLPFPDHKIIVIGASVGGPKTLKQILKEIPRNISATILIVQHLSSSFVEKLAVFLDNICPLKVKVGKNGEIIQKNVVYLAPGDKHMEISKRGKNPIVETFKSKAVNHFIPSIDVLFNSAAKFFKSQTLGILLTGMGKDGVIGLQKIKKSGGKTISESKETCVLYGMPRLAAERGISDSILPNYQITDYIIDFSKN